MSHNYKQWNYKWWTTITSDGPQLQLTDHNYSSPCQHWSLQQVWCRPCRVTLECPVHCTKCEQHIRQALWASTSHPQSHLHCLCSQSWPGMGPRSKSLQGWNNQDYKSGALIVSFCFIIFVVGFVCCSWFLVVVVCFLGRCVHMCACMCVVRVLAQLRVRAHRCVPAQFWMHRKVSRVVR